MSHSVQEKLIAPCRQVFVFVTVNSGFSSLQFLYIE